MPTLHVTIVMFIQMLVALSCAYFIRNRLNFFENFYNKFWNRHDNPKMVKSITIRGFSAIILVITFLLLNIWLIYLNFV